MSLCAALVGCGKFADMHVEEIAKLASGRLEAVCDAEPLMAEQLALRYGIRRHYDSLDRMLAEVHPDVLHITTPPQSHLELARRAVEAGCHVFVEKPVTPTLAETRRLVEVVQAAGKKLTTGWRVNFDPPALLLQRLIAEGAIGEPVHVESFYGYDLSGPYGAAIAANPDHWVRKLPGQLFQNNIDHLLNKFPPFFGNRPPAVVAQASCFRAPAAGNTPLPDELRILLTGDRITGFANFSANIKPTAHTLTVFGTRRIVHVDYVCRILTFDDGPKLPSAIGRLLPAFGQARQYLREGLRNVRRFLRSEYHFNAGLGCLIGRFYDSILNDTPPPIAYDDILWVNAVMDEVFQQACAPGHSGGEAC
jgi:predicted dehydrogenase